MSSRVIDYFALVQCRASPTFASEVRMRFPLADHDQCPFPKELHMFCFPTGDDMFRRPETINAEFSFLLTEVDGRRVYASVVRFAAEHCEGLIYCLALTSHWPFYKQMQLFLRYLRLIFSSSKTFPAPLESILTNLIYEVPLPPRGRTEVIVPLLTSSNTSLELCFKRPPPNAGALVDYDFGTLFHYFSTDNILTIFSAIFSERRIVFVANRESCLTILIEAFNCTIFPFLWRHAYIPVLPSSLIDYVCAPMPFIMGVCRPYLPDKSALSGIVIVDCDMNEVKFLDESGNEGISVQVPALPERAGKQLLKRLRALTLLPESNLVCNPDFTIDSVLVKDCFLRFFATIFISFHSYFDDSKDPCFDRKKFLDACSERCEFVNSLLNSQMFASFLDERIQFPDDMDTLLFDEYIHRENGKPAAFLADTSQTHKSRYVCQSPSNSGNTTYTSGLPLQWDTTLIPAPRQIDILVDASAELQRATATGMTYASLQFFMDQKIYSRKLHTISQRCSRDEQMFLSIVKNVNDWAAFQRSSITIECKLQFNKANLGDEFGIGDVWNEVCSFLETAQKSKQSLMKTTDTLSSDLSEQIQFIDREIRILFDESKQLDAETTMRKTELERIKLLLLNARQKLSLIEEEARMPTDLRKSVSLFKQSDLSRLVAARSEVQALSIEQSEAEAAFWTHLDLYNSRIPQIILELERLSLCRVASLKLALKLLSSNRLEQLRQEAVALETLSRSISSIDIDESLYQETIPLSHSPSSSRRGADLQRAYTPSPVPVPSVKGTADDQKEPSPVQSAPKKLSQSTIDGSLLFRYSVLLWGQFDVVFEHAVEGKAVVKQFSVLVDGASSIFEFVSRCVGKVFKSSSASRSTSMALSSKLQPNSVRYISQLSDAENALSDRIDALCQGNSQQSLQISRRFQQLFVEIRVLKRECKGSFSMIQRRRIKLESEIQAAHETYQKNGVGGFPQFSNMNSASKSQREIDMLSRQWEAAQVQHQLGNAHLLDQFQRVEQLRLSSLKRIMSDMHSALNEYFALSREMQTSLLHIINDVSVKSIINEYPDRFSDEQSNKELFEYILDGINHISVLLATLENLLSIDENLAGKLRKAVWNIRNQKDMPSISKALASVSSFFQFWPQAIDKDVTVRRDDIAELRRWRDQWHSKLTIAVGKEQAEKKNRDIALAAYERARLEVAKAMQTVTQSQERLAKSESEIAQPETGINLMRFMKTPIDKQRIRLVECQTELDTAQAHCNRMEQEKNNAERKYLTTVNSMRSFVLELEESRLNGLFTSMKKWIEHLLEGNQIVIDAVHSLTVSVREVDVQSDMNVWVESIRTNVSYECPEIVLRNLERGIENADLHLRERSDGLLAEPSGTNLILSSGTSSAAASPTHAEISSQSFPNHFNETQDEDISQSDGDQGECSRHRIEVDGPKELDVEQLYPHSRQLNSGMVSEASSISTLSD